jgi:outer membrane lipoprotein-sorting protein
MEHTMRRSAKLTIGLLALALGWPLAAGADSDGDRGRQIFSARDRMDDGFEDQRVSMQMTLRSANGRTAERRTRMQLLEGPPGRGDKMLVVFASPPDVAGTALLTHEALGAADDSQWLYLPAYKRVKRIAARDRSGSFAGTEFSYEDLAGDKLEDFTYRFVGEDSLGGKQVYRVDRMPINPNSEYSRQETWVDPDTHQILQAHLYDRKGRHLKTLETGEWERYRGKYWRPRTLSMTHVPSGRATVIKTSDYEFGVGLNDKDFSPDALQGLGR